MFLDVEARAAGDARAGERRHHQHLVDRGGVFGRECCVQDIEGGGECSTHSLALGNARYGIRVNAIMPGLMNTPMAIETISQVRGVEREHLVRERDAQVPLAGGMGSAWDIAHAALFLASDEAKFITGVVLPVDGGQSARIG